MADKRFQFSFFTNDRDQVVIRGDDQEQFTLDVEWAKSEFKVATPSTKPVEQRSDETGGKMCSKHNVVLEKRFSEAKQKWYYAHNIEGSKMLCFG